MVFINVFFPGKGSSISLLSKGQKTGNKCYAGCSSVQKRPLVVEPLLDLGFYKFYKTTLS